MSANIEKYRKKDLLLAATDVGGTFTDVIVARVDANTGAVRSMRTHKTDTTPPHFERGVLAALEVAEMDVAEIDKFVHGTTVVINAITERKGAKTALITTRGFRDVLEIQRGNRPDVFNVLYRKPTAFVPRHLRREIEERIDYQGQVVQPLKLDNLREVLDSFKVEAVEAIAISFLHSYANPVHEQALAAAIKDYWAEVTVVTSHEVCRQWREYERTNTVVMSAFVQPTTSRYIQELNDAIGKRADPAAVYYMQSSGGVERAATVARRPITLVESGPAGGVIAAAALGRALGKPNVIALDIGGTTAKCSLISNGEPRVTTDYYLERTRIFAGYPLLVPSVDIVEIGNGGGSVAVLDEQGSLKVGPRSAGAAPGPITYGLGGTEPTTTDANVLAGRLNAARVHGRVSHHALEVAHAAFAALGEALGVTAVDAVRGVLRIANMNMINALKLVSINRGYDPRDFVLVAFGGGGGLHAGALGRELGIQTVIIPAHSAVFAAWGMLTAELRKDFIVTRLHCLSEEAEAEIRRSFDRLEKEALLELNLETPSNPKRQLRHFGDLRYAGQEHTLKIEVPVKSAVGSLVRQTRQRFDAAYEAEFGYRLDDAVEMISLHLVATVQGQTPLRSARKTHGASLQCAFRGERSVDFDVAGVLKSRVYERDALPANETVRGPAIVESETDSIVIYPGHAAHCDGWGHIHMSIPS